ncbi:MAG: restriction endonuclease subunit S [Prevotella sp.]|nr:restriction endonuclease subunit S [Prevotella sp.]
MSEWKVLTAEEFCDSVRDGTHDTPRQVECGYKLVTAKHISNGQIDLSDAYLISESDYLKINERSKVERWDVLMSMIGNGLGKSAVVKDNPQYAIKNLALFKIGDETRAKWLHYYLSSNKGQGFIYNSLQGSGQPFISLSLLRKFPIPVPDDEKIMRKVVAILSRYDSLIENYQKQIKVMEEAAQRLYKEWFVDLHFPGHENTKIVDGVPEGWEYRKIGDIVIYYDKQRKPLSSMQRMSMEKIYPYYGAATLMDYVDNYLFDGIYLLLGEDGTVITPDKFPVLQYVWGKFWVNNHAHVLRGKEGISTEFLFSMFKEMPIADVVTGAAQPKISQGRLSEKKILIPSLKLIQKWSSIAKHFFDRLRVLSEQVRLLTEARDRLLPKLISGEIAV